MTQPPPHRIAITAGEPAGIGPDICLAAALQEWPAEIIAIGDPELFEMRRDQLGLALRIETITAQQLSQAPLSGSAAGCLQVLEVPLYDTCTAGELNTANARYVLDTLDWAIVGCLDKRFSAMVTAPVQKSIINEAGIGFSGHTEYLAQQANRDKVVMMLATENLRVALATTHLPLSAVPAAITPRLLKQTLRILHLSLVTNFKISEPRIAVLGLNPHAGEGGHLGREELDIIIPTLQELREEGLTLLGPLPADTAFNRKVLEQCDAVFAMYHDQGLPTLKYAGFGNAVNITLGLPFTRTSVDHGTALDLAGSGKADAGSLAAAIKMAIELS